MEDSQDEHKRFEETMVNVLAQAISKIATAKNGRQNSKELEQEIIENIMNKYHFVSLSDTKEILYYENGIYVRGGEGIIEVEAENQYSEISSYQVNEIKNHIRRRTMKDRDEFDADPNIINLKNCLFDLAKFEPIPHSPEHLSRIQLPVNYDQEAQCPNILNYFRTTLDRKYVKTALALVSCALTGTNEHQVMGLLAGSGNNGKSVFLNLNRALIGWENTSSVSPQELESDRFAVADLYGKLLNICGDLPVKPLKDTTILKKITGLDPLRAQEKFKKPFDFICKAMMLFSTNKLPESPDNSLGFFRRWIIIPFLKNFEGKEDTKLLSKMTTDEELSGYLNLLLSSIKWQRLTGGFPDLETFKEREETYRRMQNTTEYFLKDCTEESIGNYVSKDEFFERYEQYCQYNNLPTETKESFGKKLSKLGFQTKKVPINGKRTYCWRNINLV